MKRLVIAADFETQNYYKSEQVYSKATAYSYVPIYHYIVDKQNKQPRYIFENNKPKYYDNKGHNIIAAYFKDIYTLAVKTKADQVLTIFHNLKNFV